MSKVFSVDPSVSSLGWAIMQVSGRLVDAGVLKYSSKNSICERIQFILREVNDLIQYYKLGPTDYCVLESSAGIINPRSFLALERVRSSVEALAIIKGLRVIGRINPRSLQSKMLGLKKMEKRDFVKSAIRSFVIQEFRSFFDGNRLDISRVEQDLFDAVILAYYFVKLISFLKNEQVITEILSDI